MTILLTGMVVVATLECKMSSFIYFEEPHTKWVPTLFIVLEKCTSRHHRRFGVAVRLIIKKLPRRKNSCVKIEEKEMVNATGVVFRHQQIESNSGNKKCTNLNKCSFIST